MSSGSSSDSELSGESCIVAVDGVVHKGNIDAIKEERAGEGDVALKICFFMGNGRDIERTVVWYYSYYLLHNGSYY